MQASSLVALVIGAALGLGAGWWWWDRRWGASRRLEHELGLARQRLEATEGDRLALSGQARELQRALRAERSLLDGVAAQSRIAPHDLRRALARDVLHQADPYREGYERTPLEVERRASMLTTMKLGSRVVVELDPVVSPPLLPESALPESALPEAALPEAAEPEAAAPEVEAMLGEAVDQLDEAERQLAEVRAELSTCRQELDATRDELATTRGDAETLAGLLATNQRGLAEARRVVTQLRAEVEPLVGHGPTPRVTSHWSDVPQRLASLHDEVAALRSKLAERALVGDQLAVRHAELGRLLDHVVHELDGLRNHVQTSRAETPPGSTA